MVLKGHVLAFYKYNDMLYTCKMQVSIKKLNIFMKRDSSVCPIAKTLDVIGDKWSLLIIRDLLAGKQQYKNFIASPEGISTNILAARLKSLEEHGIVKRCNANDESRKGVYALTEKGRDLYKVLDVMADWGLRHIEGTAKLINVEH